MFRINKPAARRGHEAFRLDRTGFGAWLSPARRIPGPILAGLCLLLPACKDKGVSPPASAPSGSAPSAAAPAAPAASAVASPQNTGEAPSAVPAAGAAPTILKSTGYFEKPSLCEIEFEGKVKNVDKLPPKHRFWIFVAQGKADCLDPAAHIIGRTVTSATGEFSFEVFSDWAQDITFCAAALPGQEQAEGMDKPSTLYGKAPGSYHAEATGEIVWKQIDVVVKPGPAHVFPAFKGPKASPPPK